MARQRVLAIMAAALLMLTAAAGCSGPGSASGSSGGACGDPSSPTAASHLESATVAFIGIALPGSAVTEGSGRTLVSPARFRVLKWLKGSGSAVVTVKTGVTRNSNGFATGEDGIMPVAGQKWTIYATSQQMPYETSICFGSGPAHAQATP